MKAGAKKTTKKQNNHKRSIRQLEGMVRPHAENVWAVIWKNDGCVGATPKTILVVDVTEDGKTLRDKKGIGINSLALFRRRCDAETFREDNPDWLTVKMRVA